LLCTTPKGVMLSENIKFYVSQVNSLLEFFKPHPSQSKQF
jgi:long-subunit acyl-CoA synthetase (AMP-forming)